VLRSKSMCTMQDPSSEIYMNVTLKFTFDAKWTSTILTSV
jgi:hypothetical protein